MSPAVDQENFPWWASVLCFLQYYGAVGRVTERESDL